MKKIVIISDNHGDDYIIPFIKENEKNVDLYIHLGDSEFSTTQQLEDMICVTGNNDWMLDLPRNQIIEIEGHRIYITHGQEFGYFDRLAKMENVLKENDCTILLCGHTHMPMFEQNDQYTFINPGSTSWPRGGSLPSYAVLYLDKDHLECDHFSLV